MDTTNYTDIIERGVKRELPCKLTDEEELRIARQMVALKAELAERELSWDLKAKKHKQEVAETERVIAKMERELHTGQQDRVVICNRVFERNGTGGGDEVLIRLDPAHQLPTETREVQRFPASASVMQRFLPFIGGTGSQAQEDAAAQQRATEQRSAATADTSDVPADDAPAETEATDSTEGDAKPEKLSRFDEDAVANGWCGLRAESGSPCVQKADHKGLHETEEGWRWKARRPKVVTSATTDDGDGEVDPFETTRDAMVGAEA